MDAQSAASERWDYEPSTSPTAHPVPHTPSHVTGNGSITLTSPTFRSATPTKRDPSMDLDFGLDLRKFGLDNLSDEDELHHQRDLDKAIAIAAGGLVDGSAGNGSSGLLVSSGEVSSSDPTIHMLSLLYDPPVEGCELKPYTSLYDPSSTSSSHVTVVGDAQSSQLVSYQWYRGSQRLCSNGDCRQSAAMQCVTCVKVGVEDKMSWFCSDKCCRETWPLHRALHAQGMEKERERRRKEKQQEEKTKIDEAHRDFSSAEDDPAYTLWQNNSSDDDDESTAALYSKFPPQPVNSWTPISRERNYAPTADDVGCCLRLECAPILRSKDGTTSLGKLYRIDTSATIAVPPLPGPRPVLYSEHHQANPPNPSTTFKVVDYNILAQCYASSQLYPYTPIWALQWEYRKHRILQELLSYQADILAIQEMQANAFDDFFHPQLQREGYEGLYKRKTRESMTDDPSTIDGCAIFYRSDRFSLLEQYGIEYNEAARQQTMDRKALRRLMRGNIALVVVLEELTGGMAMINGMMRRMRKKRVCVANTHMYWDPDYADVKLWQTYVLTQELEKLILHRQLPLVLCGDFNSLVDSSVYEFLMTQQVQHGDDVYGEQGVGDVCHVLPSRHPHAHHPSLTHHLALTSAYASIGEPKYTNFTGHFVGVLDYVFYSRRLLRWVSVMEVEDERKVRQYTALPSPLYASDHLPLVVELEWINDM